MVIVFGGLLFTEINVSFAELLLFARSAPRCGHVGWRTVRLWFIVWAINYIAAFVTGFLFVAQGSLRAGSAEAANLRAVVESKMFAPRTLGAAGWVSRVVSFCALER